MKITIMNRDTLIKLRGEKARSDVAFELKITLQMLGAIERGDRTPSLYLAKKIADYYGTTIDDIFLNKKDTKCVCRGVRINWRFLLNQLRIIVHDNHHVLTISQLKECR